MSFSSFLTVANKPCKGHVPHNTSEACTLLAPSKRRFPLMSSDFIDVRVPTGTTFSTQQSNAIRFVCFFFYISRTFRTKQYELRLTASDSFKENYTTVLVSVKDVNDNPPVFEKSSYRTQITEEDDRGLPKRVMRVSWILGKREGGGSLRESCPS